MSAVANCPRWQASLIGFSEVKLSRLFRIVLPRGLLAPLRGRRSRSNDPDFVDELHAVVGL